MSSSTDRTRRELPNYFVATFNAALNIKHSDVANNYNLSKQFKIDDTSMRVLFSHSAQRGE